MKRKVEENVWAFLDRAGDLWGRMERERFEQEMHANVIDCGLQSPIEDLFWIACHVLAKSAFVNLNPEPHEVEGRVKLATGLYVRLQERIESYRVDFLLFQDGIGPQDVCSPVIVELDGHAFHDRDARQRSYEKARDRFLVKRGYRLLHFTGSDVVADPFKCAYEALEMLGVFSGSGRDAYDASNPIGIE